jgi:hypothetical protein
MYELAAHATRLIKDNNRDKSIRQHLLESQNFDTLFAIDCAKLRALRKVRADRLTPNQRRTTDRFYAYFTRLEPDPVLVDYYIKILQKETTEIARNLALAADNDSEDILYVGKFQLSKEQQECFYFRMANEIAGFHYNIELRTKEEEPEVEAPATEDKEEKTEEVGGGGEKEEVATDEDDHLILVRYKNDDREDDIRIVSYSHATSGEDPELIDVEADGGDQEELYFHSSVPLEVICISSDEEETTDEEDDDIVESQVEGKIHIFPHFDVLRLNSNTYVSSSNFFILHFS